MHLMEQDPNLTHARNTMRAEGEPHPQGPWFSLVVDFILPHREPDDHSTSCPLGLRNCLLYLAQDPPLAVHQAAGNTLAQLTQQFY